MRVLLSYSGIFNYLVYYLNKNLILQNMSIEGKDLGKLGEEIAEKYLSENNFKIIIRNYRSGKGEIDIIAEDPEDNYLVFLEVKTRYSLKYGAPEYAITPAKQKQIKRVAEMYLFENAIREKDCRFDVITIIMKKEPVINHYKNAFM